jgi:hypothetical protein
MAVKTAAELFTTPASGGGTIASTSITDSTAPGRALLTAATVAAQKTALAIVSTDIGDSTASGRAILTGTPAAAKTALAIVAADITDSTAHGRALLTGATTAAQRTSLGLATVAATGAYADLSGTPAAYSLPVATATTLGGIRAGTGISIAGDGTLTADLATGALSGLLSAADFSKLGSIKASKGIYANLAALQTAHPTATAGDSAQLSKGAGANATWAIWDADNTTPGWIDTGAAAVATQFESLPGLIEAPANTSYTLVLGAAKAGTISNVRYRLGAGTCTAVLSLNGVTKDTRSVTTAVTSAATTVALTAGDLIELTVSAVASAAKLNFQYDINWS